MEEVSDRCCRPRRPTSRREGGRESPPTREGSGVLGATDPDHAGGAKQPHIQYSPHKPSVRRPRPSTMSGRASAPAIHRTRGRRKEE